MALANNFISEVRRTVLGKLEPFLDNLTRLYVTGSRYRSRVTGLTDVLPGYAVLCIGYLHIVRPEIFNAHHRVYYQLDSESVTMDTLNTALLNIIALQAAENRTTVEVSGNNIPLYIKFLNVPYSVQLRTYISTLLNKETDNEELNTKLNEENYVPVINSTFEYAGVKHTVCVLQHKHADTQDEQFIVLTSNMTYTIMRIVFKTIAQCLLTDMRAAQEENQVDEELFTIYERLFNDLAMQPEENNVFNASPYVSMLVEYYTAKQFDIDLEKMLGKVNALIQIPVYYKDQTNQQLATLRSRIADLQQEIQSACLQMDRISIQQYKANESKKALDSIQDELERMVKNQQLSELEYFKNGENALSGVNFKFDVPIKIWEEDEAENYIRYKRAQNNDPEHTFTQDLFEAIFLKRTITLYSTCYVGWNLQNYGVHNVDSNCSSNVLYKYLPHMHISRYNCFGNVASYIIAALRDYDYKRALAYTLQTAMQYNFGDSVVMNHVFLSLCPTWSNENEWNNNKSKCFLEYKGKFYSPEMFWEFYQANHSLEIDKGETVNMSSGQATEPAINQEG